MSSSRGTLCYNRSREFFTRASAPDQCFRRRRSEVAGRGSQDYRRRGRRRSSTEHADSWGPARAVCLYSLEIIQALNKEGHSVKPGSCGENLTLSGLAWRNIQPGDWIRVGETVHLEVVSFTEPCKHNGRWFFNDNFMRISQDRHPGWSRLYARVLAEGVVRTGDTVTVEPAGERISR